MTSAPATGCYSGLAADEFARLCAEYPFWYHVTARENLTEIKRRGLLPWDELGRSASHVSMLPRSGCVYLVNRDREEWGWTATGLDSDDGVLLAVRLAEIEPSRIFPDEDDFNEEIYGQWDPAVYGLPGRDPGEQPGRWAERIRLGAQSGLSYELASQAGRIAVRGGIDPQLLQVVESGSSRRWEAQSHSAR